MCGNNTTVCLSVVRDPEGIRTCKKKRFKVNVNNRSWWYMSYEYRESECEARVRRWGWYSTSNIWGTLR